MHRAAGERVVDKARGKEVRNLLIEETSELDDNGESEEGAVAVEVTIQELADMDAGTCCGTCGNSCFKALAAKGYGHRKCRGWLTMTPATTSAEKFVEWTKKNPVPPSKQKLADERLAAILKFNNKPEVSGMFHIKIQTEKTAEKVSKIVGEAGGSLRFDGPSGWDGYMEFEIE